MLHAALAVLLLMLSGAIASVRAQPVTCELQYPERPEQLAIWRYFMGYYYRDDGLLRAQAEEVRRIGDDPSVVRYLDRLYLVIDDKPDLVTLIDCPGNKAALHYLYQHYDETGRFYVVRKIVHEDGPHYLLVSKKDGASTEVFGLPVWSSDKSRFVAGHCAAGPGVLSIVGVTPSELRPEATFELPCDAGHCEFKWEDPSTVLATCGGGARKLRVTGRGASWSVVPGSDPGAQMPRP